MTDKVLNPYQQIIEKLRKEAARLNHAADILEGTEVSISHLQQVKSAEFASEPLPAKSRLDQIRECVVAHGPLRQNEVIERTQIPRGTVSSMLNERYGFKKDGIGQWYWPVGIKP